MQNDNWGWRARIGLFIVASEAVPEAEWQAMAPEGVSIHAARVAAPSPWARIENSVVTLSSDLARGAEHFASMRLDAAVLAHTTSSVLGGEGWDDAVAAALSQAIGGETVVTTNGADQKAALAAMGLAKPFVVFPPWFGESQLQAGTDYYAEGDIRPVGFMRHDPGIGWRDVPPSEQYPRGLGFEQQVQPLYREIRQSCPEEADCVLIGGTGFRCVAIIDALEQDLGRPVITANQASLWRTLRLAGVRQGVGGYGRLLSDY